MSVSKRVVTGIDFGKMLIDAGVIPENCTRVIIDIPMDGVVTIHTAILPYEENMLKVNWAALRPAEIEDKSK